MLYSLFEEQVRQEAERNARLADAGTDSFAESLSYFPADADADLGPRRYLSLLERAAVAVDIPVIGSLNGVTPGGWTGYARDMQDAGAAAIELNIYYIPGDPHITGREVEQRHIDILRRVKAAVSVPVAVKLSPHFSSTGEMALRLDEAGADGLVLFNRFLQPDIDPETLTVVSGLELSSPAEARLPRTWIAILHTQVQASLAATTGVDSPADVRRCCSTAWPSGWAARDTAAWTTCAGCSPCPRAATGLVTSARAMSARCAPPTEFHRPLSSLPRNGPRVDGLRNQGSFGK